LKFSQCLVMFKEFTVEKGRISFKLIKIILSTERK